MGRTSLRPWFMGNKMQFEAVACRLFLHYSYTLAQKASNYGIFCFHNNKCRLLGGLLLNIAYAQHGLGQDDECKANLIDSYYANHLMKNYKSCDVVKEYAKEIFGDDFKL